MLGEAYRKKGDFSAATGAYSEVLKLNPKDADTYVRLAECYMQLDLLDAAGKELENALRINPQNRDAQYLQSHLREMTTPHKPGF